MCICVWNKKEKRESMCFDAQMPWLLRASGVSWQLPDCYLWQRMMSQTGFKPKMMSEKYLCILQVFLLCTFLIYLRYLIASCKCRLYRADIKGKYSVYHLGWFKLTKLATKSFQRYQNVRRSFEDVRLKRRKSCLNLFICFNGTSIKNLLGLIIYFNSIVTDTQ